MNIEVLPFEHRPRNSIANNLDKINELVDWANLDTHLYASASGERVTVGDASSVKGLTIHGKSIQDGTPTPDEPVPVEVVDGKNLLDVTMTSQTTNGLTFMVNPDKTISVTGTASESTFLTVGSVNLPDGTYRLSGCPEGGSKTTYRLYYNRSSNVVFDIGNGATIIAENEAIVQVRIAIYANVTVDMILKPQIEHGSISTPYVPYGSIGIVIGDTATPIDLQGNVLASLPDGTRDELHIDSTGRVWIEKRVGHTTQAVTDGVTGTVGTDVLSSTGQIADGADIWYKLTTPQTIELGYIDPPAIPSGSVVTVSASLTPEFHLEWWVDDGITTLVNNLIAYIDYKTEG